MNRNTGTPIEIVDTFKWEKRSKIITRDVHGVSGLMNFTHFSNLSVEPSTPMHYHLGIMEIHCVVKGRRVTRFYRNGVTESVIYSGGESLVVFPGEYHATGDESQQDPCELIAIQLNLNEADDFLGINPEKGRDLCTKLSTFPHRLVRFGSRDLALLRQAFALFSTHQKDDRDAGLMHLVCFLYRFLRMPPVEVTLRTPSDIRIQHVIEYINSNITEPMTLAELAEVADYSLSRFKTRFREETGQTPALFLTACRVDKAKEALEKTDRSVTEIAYDLGWASSNYFCSVFKKMTGVSPLQYRKQLQEP